MNTSLTYQQRRLFLLTLFLVGMALIALVASATTFVRLPFGELVRLSNGIARVRCLRSEAVMERGEIWTNTWFEVTERNKGSLPPVILVRQPGGRLGPLESRVDGVPKFAVGEEAYVFVQERPGNWYLFVGWTQGTFRIHKNVQNGMETVTQDSVAIPAYDPETRKFSIDGLWNWRVEDFRELIHQELRKQAE